MSLSPFSSVWHVMNLLSLECQWNLLYYNLTYCGASLEKEMAPHSNILAGESQGQRSLVESDPTEWLHFHFSLSCIGEGDGNLPQCSCLENPRDGGVWWAAVHRVAQSQTRLKQLSSSSIVVLPYWKIACLPLPHPLPTSCMGNMKQVS